MPVCRCSLVKRLRGCPSLLGDGCTFANFQQPRLNELRSQQWQLCMTIGLALQPPHEAAVKIWRVRFGEQFVERLSSDKVGIHSAGVPPVLKWSNLAASYSFGRRLGQMAGIAPAVRRRAQLPHCDWTVP